MNAKQKSDVAKKYLALKTAGATPDEISKAIKAENPKMAAKDLTAIMKTINDSGDAGSSSNPPPPSGSKPKKISSPNDALDLSGFDYKAMKGESFEKYVALVGDRSFTKIDKESGTMEPIVPTLQSNDEFDFVQFKAQPIVVSRFPGVPDSPTDYVGIKILNDTPIHTTRMSLKHAHEFNSQILNAHSRAGHGKYYFLKK